MNFGYGHVTLHQRIKCIAQRNSYPFPWLKKKKKICCLELNKEYTFGHSLRHNATWTILCLPPSINVWIFQSNNTVSDLFNKVNEWQKLLGFRCACAQRELKPADLQWVLPVEMATPGCAVQKPLAWHSQALHVSKLVKGCFEHVNKLTSTKYI